MGNAQFVYSRQGVSPILFDEESLGTTIRVEIAGFVGTVSTPRIVRAAENGSKATIEAPTNFQHSMLSALPYRRPGYGWGYESLVRHNYSSLATISSVLFEFELARVAPKARDQIPRIEQELEGWFSTVRDWIEIHTYQDLSIEAPLGGTAEFANFVWAYRPRRKWRVTTGAWGPVIHAGRPDADSAVTLRIWKFAIDSANYDSSPPDIYLLLRDSRSRFHRGQYGYAVIHAETAAELAVRSKVESTLESLAAPEEFVNQVCSGGLVRILKTARSLGLQQDAAGQERLSRLRNQAVHRNQNVSRQEVGEALEIAHNIVDAWAPIDDP